jgi:CheY-like chemotaxis protein
MPVMNGWNFLKEFEQIKLMLLRVPKIVFLSSSPNPEDVTKAFSHSAVIQFLSKPLRALSLKEIKNQHFS